MSILNKAGAFGALACASAIAFAAPASAQTRVYVKVVVGQQQPAPVYAGAAPCPHQGAHYAQQHAQVYHAPAYQAPAYQAPAYHAPSYQAPAAVVQDSHVMYNRPHTSIADVQPYPVHGYAPQPYHDGGAYYVAEPRKQSRWR